MSLTSFLRVSDISENGGKGSTTLDEGGDIFGELVHFLYHA